MTDSDKNSFGQVSSIKFLPDGNFRPFKVGKLVVGSTWDHSQRGNAASVTGTTPNMKSLHELFYL